MIPRNRLLRRSMRDTLSELLRNESTSQYLRNGDPVPTYFRAVVVAYDGEGAMLDSDSVKNDREKFSIQTMKDDENNKSQQYKVWTRVADHNNPRGSIRAFILNDNRDFGRDQNSLRTYWPKMSSGGIQKAAVPGEVVLVHFEYTNVESPGFWEPIPWDNNSDNPGRHDISEYIYQSQVERDSLQKLAWEQQKGAKVPVAPSGAEPTVPPSQSEEYDTYS